jgi:hypothetical protein
MEALKPGPRILEAFEDYAPPFSASESIGRMLKVVPPELLHELDAIVLTNAAALSEKERGRKTWGHENVPLDQSMGYYSPGRNGEPARIRLLVDNIEKSWGRPWFRIGIVREAMVSEILFHEIDLHVRRIPKLEYAGKENGSQSWSNKLSRRFMRDRYGHLLPIAAPIFLTIGVGKEFGRIYRRTRN